MSSSGHLSIGEVLSLVQEEFPDVSISKIRFLEAQGLLDPERTPSGYRKFYEPDIDRLRWVLIQQRDNFLPLRVIKDRLDEWDRTGEAPDDLPAAPIPAGAAKDGMDSDAPAGDADTQAPTAADSADIDATVPAVEAPGAAEPGVEPEPGSTPAADDTDDDLPSIFRQARDDGFDVRAGAASLASASAEAIPAAAVTESASTSAPATPTPVPVREPAERTPLQVDPEPPPTMALTRNDLASKAGVDPKVIDDLEGFGLLHSRRVGPDNYYDGAAVEVVEACATFLRHGVEPRHLRMYKIAAEREAGFFEQLVMPLLKQRNPESREKAVSTVNELADVGEQLHAAVLRQILHKTFS